MASFLGYVSDGKIYRPGRLVATKLRELGFIGGKDDGGDCGTWEQFLRTTHEVSLSQICRANILTCRFHHQSPVHISSNRRFFPSASVYTRSGEYAIFSLKAGFPINLRKHSIGSRRHISSSFSTTFPSSSFKSPTTLTRSQVQSAPVGNSSTFFVKR